MELIDWTTVLTAVVAGAILLSLAWFVVALGTAYFRRRGEFVREKKSSTPPTETLHHQGEATPPPGRLNSSSHFPRRGES
ncbi:MAG TPA: hypothetical protein VLM40_04550 [Gemmata sp.]|nr:hypothetical protein [Gemmata sp.]